MKKQSILILVAVLFHIYFASVYSALGASFQGLGDLPGGYYDSVAIGVSADGSVVVGISSSNLSSQAFRWTKSTGMVNLGALPGGSSFSHASDISNNGSIIVGDSVAGELLVVRLVYGKME
jgi:probable HAF family extracellular repeat protein